MAWTEEQIRQWLDKTEFNLYQGIDLPFGLEVPGPRRDQTIDAGFGNLPIAGKSIWDIGSHYGCVPNILADRGAARVLGTEARPEYFGIAQTIASIRGTDHTIQFVNANAEIAAMPPPRSFDYVTLLNVTHHLYFPVSTLVCICDRAAEAVIIEWATLGTYNERHERHAPKSFDKWPILLADKYNCWYFTEPGLEAILSHCQFKSITHRQSPLAPNRRITTCQR